MVEDIDGKETATDVRKQLGNYLYYQSRDLQGSELGKRIYFSAGEEEINKEEAAAITKAAAEMWPSWVIREAVRKSLSTTAVEKNS